MVCKALYRSKRKDGKVQTWCGTLKTNHAKANPAMQVSALWRFVTCEKCLSLRSHMQYKNRKNGS